jgi:hypothetical protein
MSWQWPLTLLIAISITTAIEAGVVSLGFEIELDRKRFAVLYAANAVSVGVAFVSVLMYPPRH